jgi:uncharacterized protein (DUF983 family)
MASWFRLRAHCEKCGLRFERDEQTDYWLGAYLLNFLVTEGVFAVALLIILLVTWPAPPWRLLLYGGAVLMVLTPVLFYPFAKALWLATDLVFRPVKPEDLS